LIDESSLDFDNSRGEPWPPLLRNWPLNARIYLSWLDFNYFDMLAYLRFSLSSSFFLYLACSSSPVFIFFWRAANSVACLALSVLRAVSILIFLALIQASFSLFYSSANLCWTLCASVYLNRKNKLQFLSGHMFFHFFEVKVLWTLLDFIRQLFFQLISLVLLIDLMFCLQIFHHLISFKCIVIQLSVP
jgi:hypothetical protein